LGIFVLAGFPETGGEEREGRKGKKKTMFNKTNIPYRDGEEKEKRSKKRGKVHVLHLTH